MRKKFLAGAAILALLMNAPQVSADDDIVIFGGEFEDEATPSASKKVEKPASSKPNSSKPKVEPPQKVEEPSTQPIEQPKVEEPSTQPIEQPTADEPSTQPIQQPTVDEPSTQPIQQPTIEEPSTQPIEQPTIDEPSTQPIERPTVDEPSTQPIQPTEKILPPTVEPLPSVELDRPFEQPTKIFAGQEPARLGAPSYSATPQTLKTLKPRFLKLAVDDTYTYYLDKESVQWKRVPYLANEYMADVWVRMIEREPSHLSEDMASYGAENFRAEVALAREQGYQYSPEDLKVLRSQSYVLEHYYLRPKTKQIQFLCELEVFGRPQNAINERAYEYKNWENLVPGSIEASIYNATIKIIGKSKASGKGHMTFIDMLDEYARIALN